MFDDDVAIDFSCSYFEHGQNGRCDYPEGPRIDAWESVLGRGRSFSVECRFSLDPDDFAALGPINTLDLDCR